MIVCRDITVTENAQLVVFDTNAIEERYLAPLLRGEQCRDFDRLRAAKPAYTPSLYVKSYYEICSHAKVGNKRFPWMVPELGYPGGIAEGKRILHDAPECAAGTNLHHFFGLCEEWRDRDWDQMRVKTCEWVQASQRETMVLWLDVCRRFSEWKFALSGFCQHIWDVLNLNMRILTQGDLFLQRPGAVAGVFSLEQELAREVLVPNEDLEIVVAALLCDAVAFVTSDQKILDYTGRSLGYNYRTNFVHTDQLMTALEKGFQYRWSEELSRPRRSPAE